MNTDSEQKGKCCGWLNWRVHLRAYGVCTFACLQRVSANVCVLWVCDIINLNQCSTQKLLICPIYYEVFHSTLKDPRIHMLLDWNHCQWDNLANTLRGVPILKVSESLIFSRKSSGWIYGKWESGDGKWCGSAGYSVITAFFYRQSMVSSYFQACG